MDDLKRTLTAAFWGADTADASKLADKAVEALGPLGQMHDAAIAYGAAWAEYTAKYDAWRSAHPEDEPKQDHDLTPSWIADVKPSCQASNVAMYKLCNLAIELHRRAT